MLDVPHEAPWPEIVTFAAVRMYPEDVVEAVFTSFRNNQGDTMERSVSSTETIFQDRGLVKLDSTPSSRRLSSLLDPFELTKAQDCFVRLIVANPSSCIHNLSMCAVASRTIVFIDIYDFGKVVAGLHPVDLVLMLDRVFTQMDLVCQDSQEVFVLGQTIPTSFACAGAWHCQNRDSGQDIHGCRDACKIV